MIGTLGVRYEPAVQTARFRPYVSGGLGFNHTEQEFEFRIATVTGFDESISHSGFAFSAGGGANVRLFSSRVGQGRREVLQAVPRPEHHAARR